jgi:UDP-2,3-diacylglucosamine hydrolase
MKKILTLLAGGGTLPAKVAAAAKAQGFAVQVVGFVGQPQPEGLTVNTQFKLGQVGRVLAYLKATGTTHVCLAGGLKKPSIFALWPDVAALKILCKALAYKDDALLRAVIDALKTAGIQVVAAQTLLPSLVIPAGSYGPRKLNKTQLSDVKLATAALKKLGEADLGQACVVKAGSVLGLEDARGTDALLARHKNQNALLVKRAKPQQTMAADVPFVGLQTLKNLKKYGYAGLVVQAGATLAEDISAMQTYAQKNGLVFCAVK